MFSKILVNIENFLIIRTDPGILLYTYYYVHLGTHYLFIFCLQEYTYKDILGMLSCQRGKS